MDEDAIVIDVVHEIVEEEPPQLFDLTGLQKEANSRYGLSAAETLSCAQSLYEEGELSYPRTSSHSITSDMGQSVSELLSGAEGVTSSSDSHFSGGGALSAYSDVMNIGNTSVGEPRTSLKTEYEAAATLERYDVLSNEVEKLKEEIKAELNEDPQQANIDAEKALYDKGQEVGFSKETIKEYVNSLSAEIYGDLKWKIKEQVGSFIKDDAQLDKMVSYEFGSYSSNARNIVETNKKLAGLSTIQELSKRYDSGEFESSKYSKDDILNFKINAKSNMFGVNSTKVTEKDYSKIEHGELLPRADEFISDKAVESYLKELCPKNENLQKCNTLSEMANELYRNPVSIDLVAFQNAEPGGNNVIKFHDFGYGQIETGGPYMVPASELESYAKQYPDICEFKNGNFAIKDYEQFGETVLSGVPLNSVNGAIVIEASVPINSTNISMPSVNNGSAYAAYFVSGGHLLSGGIELTTRPIKMGIEGAADIDGNVRNDGDISYKLYIMK